MVSMDQESLRTIPKPKKRLYAVLHSIVWGTASGIIVANFFFSAFFPEFTPFPALDVGIAILVVPAFCGFIMGIMLNEYEMRIAIYASFLMTMISLAFIFVTVFLPIITGTVTDIVQLASGEEQRQALVLSSIFVLPISVIGGIFGKAFGDVYLPSDEERTLRRMLAKDTKLWHRLLQKYFEKEIEEETVEEEEVEENSSEMEPPEQG
ncbi:MAG: hypothetical protein JSV43_05270 [Methanobacteriota archaeon]|nr:MAG: hypothetical protein JSV43_05270 [Euryarchaeota archaeon]